MNPEYRIRNVLNWMMYGAIIACGFAVCKIACGQPRYVLPCSQRLVSASMDSLQKFVGIKEATGNNDGFDVARLLRHVHIYYPAAWCAATAVSRFDTALIGGEVCPILRSAGAVAIGNDARRRGILKGYGIVKAGDCLVWRHAGTAAGHIAAGVVSVKYPYVLDIEGNTTSGNKGNQRDGGGCYRRLREWGKDLGTLQPLCVIGFGT